MGGFTPVDTTSVVETASSVASSVVETASTVLEQTAHLANPTTPAFEDNFKWIEAYLTIHVASYPSRRYSYVLWVLIGLVFFIVAFLHLTGSSTGIIGARWNKWALRRRTIRKKHARMVAWREGRTPHPYSLPPNGQILSLGALLVTTMVLCFLGPDYIFPEAQITEFRRALTTADGEPFKISDFFPFQPQYSVQKAWWTSANRTGTIAFALFPLCILFGLKQPPFAIFANPFTLQFHFDKLVWLHRWSGRLIWFITTLHVVFWSIQLVNDKRGDEQGHVAYHYAWLHHNFINGWIAFGFLSSIILFSIPPIRTKYYETFYLLHVLLIPLTLIFSALHHPPIAAWCWTALALWICERLWRAARWVHNNTFLWSNPSTAVVQTPPVMPDARMSISNREREQWEMRDMHSRHPSFDQKPGHSRSMSEASMYKALVPYARVAYAPPPGFAHAQVLSGRTIRLTFTSPGYFSWAPGQHFIITVPYISKFTSHPFTCASICDLKAPGDSGRVIVFLIRAKGGFTKQLWNTVTSLTTQFKTYAPGEQPPKDAELPMNGTLLRMYVDGPFGSSSRARWGSHSSVLIIAGGSGVSFGISVLEYICLCIAGRDGEQLGGRSSGWGRRGFLTTRVRFIWLVREYAHIQWCATAIRRCLGQVPPPGLQIDIFVTNFKTLEHERKGPKAENRRSSKPPPPKSYAPVSLEENPDDFLPPAPHFTRHGPDSRRSSVSSIMSLQSANSSVESFVDMNPITEDYGDELHAVDLSGERGNYTLDLTNFEGDDDAALPGEEALSNKVRKTGKILREKTRKAKKALAAKELRERAAQLEGHRMALETHSRRVSTDAVSLSRPVSGRFDGERLNLPDSPPSSGRPASPFGRASSPAPPRSRPTSMSADPVVTFKGVDWDAESGRALVARPERLPSTELKLEIEDNELDDVNFVSECARPGKPKIDRILADEVEHSTGSIIVGCCGPSSLNAMVRRSIALQIDVARLQQGDRRGRIELVSEEFAY